MPTPRELAVRDFSASRQSAFRESTNADELLDDAYADDRVVPARARGGTKPG